MFLPKRVTPFKYTQDVIYNKFIINNKTLKLCKQIRLDFSSVADIKTVETNADIKPEKKKRNVLPSKEIVKFISKKDLPYPVPIKLLRRKRSSLESLYLVDKDVAKEISEIVLRYIKKDKKTKVFEANPGMGLLTEYLLDANQSLTVLEGSSYYAPRLKELYLKYHGKLEINYSDFFSLGKLSFLDKKDGGDRVKSMFAGVESVPWGDQLSMRIIGAMPAVNFIKYMIFSIIQHQGLFSYGRCELFLTMIPYFYIHLSCGKEAGYLTYRSTSIMFQILFEYEIIKKLPRKSFLPWETDYSNTKLAKLRDIDDDHIYLVRITPRKNLQQLCPPEQLQQLWYFIRHHCISRKNRIIPNLERWIPNCGTRLITHPENTFKTPQIFKTEFSIEESISHRSSKISDKDFYSNMTIFTEFGDLSPSQLLTVFRQFSSWPEYRESPFLASMESSLMKMEDSAEEADDDVEHDDNEEVQKET